MSDINTETGESAGSRSPRFTQWVLFLVFSTITLGSAVQEKKQNEATSEASLSDQKWTVTCAAITFTLTLIMVLAQLHPVSSLFVVGTKVEGIVCILLLAFWAATVAVVSDAANGLAVNLDGSVKNGNLYYFSWAGMVTAIMLSISYLRGVFGVDVAGGMRNRSARLTTWSALLASSIIVMGACCNILDQDCKQGTEDETFCRRTRYGIALGATATAFSLGIVALKIATTAAPFVVEGFLALILSAMYTAGVAVLTSAKGPGSEIGNLYYFSWIGFVCCFLLLASCLEDYKGGKRPADAQNGDHNGDIQVEAIDDTI